MKESYESLFYLLDLVKNTRVILNKIFVPNIKKRNLIHIWTILHNGTFEVFVTKIALEGESHKNDIH